MRWMSGGGPSAPCSTDRRRSRSIPRPLMSLPIRSMMRTSSGRSAGGPGGCRPRPGARARARTSRAAGIASIRAQTRVAILDERNPEPDRGPGRGCVGDGRDQLREAANPWPWKVSAPAACPGRSRSSSSSPLSTGPLKSVWGFTRLIGMISVRLVVGVAVDEDRDPVGHVPSGPSPCSSGSRSRSSFGDPQRGEDLQLALGRGAAVAAHRRHDERLRATGRGRAARRRG